MSDQSFVFTVTPQTFQAEVIDRSQQLPVIVLFWAEQAAPATEARSTLERLVPQYQGKVALALVDVAEDQSLAQQLRVTGLPSIRVIKEGQIVEQLEGPQPEATLTALLDQLTMSSADLLRDQLAELVSARDFTAALNLYRQALNTANDDELTIAAERDTWLLMALKNARQQERTFFGFPKS